nr:uncharacterized protein LOC100208779 [Hydra vulgaris]
MKLLKILLLFVMAIAAESKSGCAYWSKYCYKNDDRYDGGWCWTNNDGGGSYKRCSKDNECHNMKCYMEKPYGCWENQCHKYVKGGYCFTRRKQTETYIATCETDSDCVGMTECAKPRTHLIG